jgi:hypothetical protein
MEGLNRPLRTSEPFLIITESTTAIHIFTSKNCVKPSKRLGLYLSYLTLNSCFVFVLLLLFILYLLILDLFMFAYHTTGKLT